MLFVCVLCVSRLRRKCRSLLSFDRFSDVCASSRIYLDASIVNGSCKTFVC